MKSIPFIFLIAFLFVPSVQAITIAQLALGGGYECLLIISNKKPFEWKGRFFLKSRNDQTWPRPWSLNGGALSTGAGFTATVPPNGTVKAVIGGDSVTQSGYLEYFGDGSSSSLDVVVSYFYVYKSNNVLQDSVGSAKVDSHRGFEFPVERSATVDTGFAWAPDFTTTPFPIILTLYTAQGNLFQQKTVTFNGHTAIFFSQMFDNVPGNFLGRVRMEAQNFFYLEVLRLEQIPTGFQLTSTPPDWFIP